MTTAVITFTYNEAVNLPIWIRYYGKHFGEDNLFVVDRGSDDESLTKIGRANLIRVPRKSFDEFEKTNFVSKFHASLLNFYDTVIITDCDEILVADPLKFSNIQEYVENMDVEHINAIGLQVLHIIDRENPIDLCKPILSQRSYSCFSSLYSKPLISRVPMDWTVGFHSSDKAPQFDGGLYLFHTKVMDFNIALARQQINRDTIWSTRSLELNLGFQHRFDDEQFVHRYFHSPLDIINRGDVHEFDFSVEVGQIIAHTRELNLHKIEKIVRIPERFQSAF